MAYKKVTGKPKLSHDPQIAVLVEQKRETKKGTGQLRL
jgi:hypothetical protein